MQTKMQRQQPNKSLGHNNFPWKRFVIILSAILLISIGAILWILSGNRGLLAITISTIFVAMSIAVGLLQWLFPFPSGKSEHSASSIQIPLQPVGSQESVLGQSALAVLPQKIQRPVSNLPNSNSLFLVGTPLPTIEVFHGREHERMELFGQVSKAASVSIVGERRIGKTWLLNYLRLSAQDEFGPNCHIGIIDATSPDCQTTAGFIKKALTVLGYNGSLNHSHIGLGTLQKYLQTLKTQNQLAILCIDEAEGMSDPSVFDLDFFKGLRAFTQEYLIIIVTASITPLNDIIIASLGTSPFFNVCYPIILEPFTIAEAKAFIEAKRVPAGFSDDDCVRLLEYGKVNKSNGEEGWPPYRLQLEGQMLLGDKMLVHQDPDRYRPQDARYWQDFERRLAEKYRTVVP